MQWLALALFAVPTIQLELTLGSWEKTARGADSLAVEFTGEQPPFSQLGSTSSAFDGKLQLARRSDGKMAGFMELKPKLSPEDVHRFWLFDEQLYIVRPRDKLVLITPAPRQESIEFLARYLHPFIRCVNSQSARRSLSMKVTKQDEWYTYIEVRPCGRQRFGWFGWQEFTSGRLVVMNRDAPDLPHGAPRELYIQNDVKWSITKWRVNCPEAKKLNKPEIPADWKVENLSR